MSQTLKVRQTEPTASRNGGRVWNQLRSEREDVCQALLKDARTDSKNCAKPKPISMIEAAYWHREVLQARLRKIDDALDRLMSGSYGNCTQCRRWIEDTKLAFDPAIAYCPDCWDRIQRSN